MKTKTWLPIAVALVLGVFAAVLAKKGMSSGKTATTTGTVKLIVAQRMIAPGASIVAADLETRPVAPEELPAGAFIDASTLVGRTAQGQLAKGQPVLESQLAPEGTGGGLQALVPPGMRAMTIEVNEFSSVGGMIRPGSRVDIISTMQNPRLNESMSRTIAQNVLVKAVGQETGRLDDKGEEQKVPKSVTLLVSSKQAESIQLSTISGRPWLVLRGNSDNAIATLGGTTLAELRGAAPGIARDMFAALRNARPAPVQSAMSSVNPSTQPVASQPGNWAPARSVHVIRNTVESTVSVAPTIPPRETITSATIEP